MTMQSSSFKTCFLALDQGKSQTAQQTQIISGTLLTFPFQKRVAVVAQSADLLKYSLALLFMMEISPGLTTEDLSYS